MEVARPYFKQQSMFGAKLVFRWSPKERYEHLRPSFAHSDVECIEGVEFQTQEAAFTFDLDQVKPDTWKIFSTWPEAIEWLYANT